MTVQVYGSRAGVEALLSPASILAAIDVDEDGVESTYEESLIDAAIIRAALKINQQIRHQYKLSDVTNNDYLEYANNVYAAYEIRTLSGDPAEPSLQDKYQEIEAVLKEVRWGRDQLPDQSPSFDHLPTVSSLQVNMANPLSPVVVNTSQSTGSAPVGNRRRVTGPNWSNFWY